jgi:hypothetical protein
MAKSVSERVTQMGTSVSNAAKSVGRPSSLEQEFERSCFRLDLERFVMWL